MHTAIGDKLGIEFRICSSTHCHNVVAVSKVDGFVMLGAVSFTLEQLKSELNWIDEHVRNHPLLGRDIVTPNK